EPADTAGISDPKLLRQALLNRRASAGESLRPVDVEEDYRRLNRQRELQANLARLAALGARVEYQACDVKDAAAFKELVAAAYERHGRIDAAIHGAGVIEDKLVRDKRLDSFLRVIETKAASAVTLVEALQPDSLRFLAFFSSVSGRFGNRGQADYAAASEMLNKLAQRL